jgi:hypothetical protein
VYEEILPRNSLMAFAVLLLMIVLRLEDVIPDSDYAYAIVFTPVWYMLLLMVCLVCIHTSTGEGGNVEGIWMTVCSCIFTTAFFVLMTLYLHGLIEFISLAMIPMFVLALASCCTACGLCVTNGCNW